MFAQRISSAPRRGHYSLVIICMCLVLALPAVVALQPSPPVETAKPSLPPLQPRMPPAMIYGLADGQPLPPIQRVWCRVTACSPEDPLDRAYYAAHGYEGAPYGIAAAPAQFPKGTRIRIPGYLTNDFPYTFWPVDSKGGSVIRNSVKKGILHIDVKFRSYQEAKQWGDRWLLLEVMYP